MNAVRYLLALVATALAATTASAQFVKGNEAVKVMPDGTTKVETPPLPSTTLGAPCAADKPACTASGWRMVETSEGLRVHRDLRASWYLPPLDFRIREAATALDREGER